MTKEVKVLYVGQDTIGWLCWWTIAQGDYDVAELKQSAVDVGLDDFVVDRIKGRNLNSAFLAATRTGAPGIPVPTTSDRTARLISKEADARHQSHGRDMRALVYQETTPGAENISEIVSSKTAALMLTNHASQTLDVAWANWAKDDDRITHVIDQMRVRLGAKIGTIDDGRIRSIVTGWLRERHRITVRGTGGVYFVPAPTDMGAKKGLQDELVAMRAWLATIGSPFSIVAFNERGALSLDDFVHDAVSEIEEELTSIAGKLAKWDGNEGMNSGSRMFSSSTQINRMKQLKDKIIALQQSLGESIGSVEQTFALLDRKAHAMLEQSSAEVAASKLQRTQDKEQKKAARQAKREQAKGKKSGTASDRAKKQTIE